MLSGDTQTDRGRAVLVLGKQVMHNHRGVPWQLYCQVCTKALVLCCVRDFVRLLYFNTSVNVEVASAARPWLAPRWASMCQVLGVFKEMVRRHHVLFSIFCAHDDAQVVLTLTQRVTVGQPFPPCVVHLYGPRFED